MTTETRDRLAVAREARDRAIDQAREQADREFVAVIREELKTSNMVEVAKRTAVTDQAGAVLKRPMTRENLYRLMRACREEAS